MLNAMMPAEIIVILCERFDGMEIWAEPASERGVIFTTTWSYEKMAEVSSVLAERFSKTEVTGEEY